MRCMNAARRVTRSGEHVPRQNHHRIDVTPLFAGTRTRRPVGVRGRTRQPRPWRVRGPADACLQLHVGLDAWNLTPVPLGRIDQWLARHETPLSTTAEHAVVVFLLHICTSRPVGATTAQRMGNHAINSVILGRSISSCGRWSWQRSNNAKQTGSAWRQPRAAVAGGHE